MLLHVRYFQFWTIKFICTFTWRYSQIQPSGHTWKSTLYRECNFVVSDKIELYWCLTAPAVLLMASLMLNYYLLFLNRHLCCLEFSRGCFSMGVGYFIWNRKIWLSRMCAYCWTGLQLLFSLLSYRNLIWIHLVY